MTSAFFMQELGMKLLITLCALFLTPLICAKESEGRQRFHQSMKELILTYSSDISYEDAMQKFYQRKPTGYVMDSMMQYRSGKNYIIKVKLRKI